MSGVIDRMPIGRIGLSVLIGLGALVTTSFLDARPDSRPAVGRPIPSDLPIGAPWCGPRDGIAGSNCRYATFEQCLAAVGGAYATCRPNPSAVVIPDEGPYRTYQSVFL